jgi:hypothetical protein
MQPEMKPVGSSLVEEVGYYEEKKELWVRFHEGAFTFIAKFSVGLGGNAILPLGGPVLRAEIKPVYSCLEADQRVVY